LSDRGRPEASGGRARPAALVAIGSAHGVAINTIRATSWAEALPTSAAGRARPPEASRRSLFLIALLLIVLAGCAKHEQPVQARLTKVTMNVNPSMTYAPIMIAKDEGFFAEEGIDAEFVSLDSNSAVAAAAAGKLDVLSAGVRSGIFNMMLKGVPLQIVADKGHGAPGDCLSEAFIAPVETAKRIASRNGSLRGERLALTRGGSLEFLTMRLLEKQQLTIKDVVIVQMPQGTAASSRDKVDAIRFTSEPNLSSALAEGWAAVVARPQDVEPGHQTAVVLFGKRLLRDDPELGRRYMRAYLRGVQRYNEGKTDRNIATIARHTKLPPDIIRRSCWVAVNNDGRIDPAGVQPFLDWALANHYLDGKVPLDLWWNPAFIDAAATKK
jgi:NitT/TauT family transport system substrate-binding protein